MRHLLDFQDINKNRLENLIEKTRSLEVLASTEIILLRYKLISVITKLTHD